MCYFGRHVLSRNVALRDRATKEFGSDRYDRSVIHFQPCFLSERIGSSKSARGRYLTVLQRPPSCLLLNGNLQYFQGCWFPLTQSLVIILQVQNILKRLETPYSEDVEDKEASFYQTASTTNPSLSTDYKKTTIFNVSDIHEPYLDKPPDDALNMRLS